MSAGRPLLEVDALRKHFSMTRGVLNDEIGRVKAVDGITFEIREGETFGVVGESGCGKSTAARTILRLEEPTSGTVRFDGQDITEYGRTELKRFRREAQMIFQDPDSSFDPRMSVGESLAEPLIVHGMTDRKRRRRIVEAMLVRVGLQAEDIDRYPHEFSGGQKQRIGLARALVLNPRLLVADEPVSALDVSVQAEILNLMADLQREFGLSILLISHNLGVIRHICDRVGVMYLGELVEVGPTEDIFADPQHPYTRALISAIPSTDLSKRGERVRLSGTVPDPSNPPRGCRFHTRCPEVIPPEEHDIDQRTWRSLLEFKQRVEDGLDREELYELLHPDEPPEEADVPDRLHEDAVDAALRAEYELESGFTDSTVEAGFERAVQLLTVGDVETARTHLESTFPTVCQRSDPETQTVGPAHRCACHLTDERRTATGQKADADTSHREGPGSLVE
ncbi:ABC transporter ATP-binding protein [Natrarchaeobaculum sulfurireducens]|uniref:Oligopeptide transport ATP-binding protein OppF n=1 Tax=Natrarchaeobaculum sulfurireducens TaxID=2044521 RepID=A0A346PMM4_9EURY|nr:oligopeptide/dipeptide ABC transporter ATP-binding protein [Natrarchaeobaculum sulfurireducens]AXR80769.1 Oligopeptide transport ATP-binding protein OppF [Natrarchaeobaculum sulfurireducens]